MTRVLFRPASVCINLHIGPFGKKCQLNKYSLGWALAPQIIFIIFWLNSTHLFFSLSWHVSFSSAEWNLLLTRGKRTRATEKAHTFSKVIKSNFWHFSYMGHKALWTQSLISRFSDWFICLLMVLCIFFFWRAQSSLLKFVRRRPLLCQQNSVNFKKVLQAPQYFNIPWALVGYVCFGKGQF